MKKMKILSMAVGLLVFFLVSQVQSVQDRSELPPVAPVLVRQGDFAISLLEVLDLGVTSSESEAQEILVELGIGPINGWVSDYPMTPDIIGELEAAVVRAADSGYLKMNHLEVTDIFRSLVAGYGFPIIPDNNQAYHNRTPPSHGPYGYTDNYVEPTVINNYYYRTGPPVITYYSPPSAYYGLYSWVPYPFWWGGFWFSGYYVMNDFHRTSRVVILNGYGPKKRFRSHADVIGVISNRSKKYHHMRRDSADYYFRKKVGGYVHPGRGYAHPGIRTRDKVGIRNYGPGSISKTNDPRILRRDHQQAGNFPNNRNIRNEIRSNEKPSFNRSNKRFRSPENQTITNRSPRIGNYGNTQRQSGSLRPTMDNNFGKKMTIRSRNNASVDRSPSPAGLENIRSSIVRERRNSNAVGNRERFSRSSNISRPLQGADGSSFQRSQRGRSDFSSSGFKGSGGARGFNQGNFSR